MPYGSPMDRRKVKLRNNILAVKMGYDIYVSGDSQVGFSATTTIYSPRVPGRSPFGRATLPHVKCLAERRF